MMDKTTVLKDKMSENVGNYAQITAQEEFTSVLGVLMDARDPTGQADYFRHESFYCQLSVFKELVRLVGSNRNLKILELGCGSGFLSIALSQMGFSVTTSDFFEDTNQKLKNLLEQTEFKKPVHFIQQNLEEDKYKFEKGYYDVVITVDVVEHIKNVKNIFKNAYDCLKINGILIVHTPNYERLNVRIKAVKNIFNPSWPIHFESYIKDDPYLGHVREFTPKELVELYKAFNFEVLVQRFPKSVTLGRVPKISNRLLKMSIRRSWQVQEITRQFFPSLGPAQLVVGRKN